VIALLGPLPLTVPVDPDAPEAQRWLLRELAKAPYQQQKPGLFDQLLQQILDWLESLLPKSGIGPGPDLGGLVPVIGVVVLVVLLVVAFLVFGLPRLNRRSRAGGELFGEDDERDAVTLRRVAERAAAAEDWTTAIVELFRALARRLDERAIVSSFPGTTARGFATRAGEAYPDAAARLTACAADVDAVRYLGEAGTREGWERIRALEAELRDARSAHAADLDDLVDAT
jgi:hypothetical protein